MKRSLRAVLAGALALAACRGDSDQPRTTTELLRRAGAAPGPDVLLVVNGRHWAADSVDRVDVKAIRSMEVVTDTAAIRYLYQKPYRAMVLIDTRATPFD